MVRTVHCLGRRLPLRSCRNKDFEGEGIFAGVGGVVGACVGRKNLRVRATPCRAIFKRVIMVMEMVALVSEYKCDLHSDDLLRDNFSNAFPTTFTSPVDFIEERGSSHTAYRFTLLALESSSQTSRAECLLQSGSVV